MYLFRFNCIGNETVNTAMAAASRSSGFQKPPTTTLTFAQKRFDRSGTIVDDDGTILYKLRDTSEDHSSFSLKSYPLEVRRASDDSLALAISWRYESKDTFVTGLDARIGEVKLQGGLLDEDFAWKLPNGERFEWDGYFGGMWNLIDYRVRQPYSMTPAVVAQYTPRESNDEHAKVEILTHALEAGTPGFLDHIVATVLWLELKLYETAAVETVEAVGEGLRKGARKGVRTYYHHHD